MQYLLIINLVLIYLASAMVGTVLELTCDLENNYFDFKDAGFVNTIYSKCSNNG